MDEWGDITTETAYAQGAKDRQAGEPIELNPYAHTVFEYYLYCAGWNDTDIGLMSYSKNKSK